MRGRRVISVVLLFSAILMVSGVFASGLVTIPVSLNNILSPTEGAGIASVKANVTITPDTIVNDYEYYPEYRVGENFTVDVNVELLPGQDLFTWQVNLTWDPAFLSFSLVKEYGPFLRGTSSLNGTSGWINRNPANYVTIAKVNNTAGYASVAETILDKSPGAAGVTGSGRVVSINFTILAYGWTEIKIGTSGTLPTKLLDSAGASLEFDGKTCWFDNRITGDVDSSEIVSMGDANEIRTRWLSTPTSGPYARYADLDLNDVISMGDANIVRNNWLRARP